MAGLLGGLSRIVVPLGETGGSYFTQVGAQQDAAARKAREQAGLSELVKNLGPGYEGFSKAIQAGVSPDVAVKLIDVAKGNQTQAEFAKRFQASGGKWTTDLLGYALANGLIDPKDLPKLTGGGEELTPAIKTALLKKGIGYDAFNAMSPQQKQALFPEAPKNIFETWNTPEGKAKVEQYWNDQNKYMASRAGQTATARQEVTERDKPVVNRALADHPGATVDDVLNHPEWMNDAYAKVEKAKELTPAIRTKLAQWGITPEAFATMTPDQKKALPWAASDRPMRPFELVDRNRGAPVFYIGSGALPSNAVTPQAYEVAHRQARPPREQILSDGKGGAIIVNLDTGATRAVTGAAKQVPGQTKPTLKTIGNALYSLQWNPATSQWDQTKVADVPRTASKNKFEAFANDYLVTHPDGKGLAEAYNAEENAAAINRTSGTATARQSVNARLNAVVNQALADHKDAKIEDVLQHPDWLSQARTKIERAKSDAAFQRAQLLAAAKAAANPSQKLLLLRKAADGLYSEATTYGQRWFGGLD